MTGQLDLFAAPVAPVAVEPTRDVLRLGARAAGVPSHQHASRPRPKAMRTDDEWLRVLRVAENEVRWRSWTQPHPIPLDRKPDVCGGGSGVWYDGRGVAIVDEPSWDRRYVGWPAVLKGLAAQRDAEPEVADARDLAHAYSALETYHRYYLADDAVAGSDDFRPTAERHFAWLKQVIVDLGGDPTVVP